MTKQNRREEDYFMYCKKCGKELPDNSNFCTRCGFKINVHPNPQFPAGEKPGFRDSNISSARRRPQNSFNSEPISEREQFIWKKEYTIIAIAAGVLIVAGIVLILWISGIKKNKESKRADNEITSVEVNDNFSSDFDATDDYNTTMPSAENKQRVEPITEPATELPAGDDYASEPAEGDFNNEAFTDMDETTENSDNRELLDMFGIDAQTVEDYSANLDPSAYRYYDANIGEFYFSYPAYLFNSVTVDDSPYTDVFGNNIKTVVFSGSKGSELSYSIYEKPDGLSISEATNRINQNEHDNYYDITDILVKSDDEKGRIVLSGTLDSDGRYRIYDLIKVDDRYVYRMLSVKPKYQTEEERLWYAYVTENEYRMCGFSGSSQAARSFEEYLESNQ